MGGATQTFPTVILLKSQIDSHPVGTADIACLALPSGQSGNGQENCFINGTLHQFKGEGCVNKKKTIR